ncbi:F0F1 ATP synthase subunit delta [Dethiothermospora halolimnae]|uniref:F0F1 ATP synthase subunit delta n=1 Tax=Dethiothermospora halolimnae TaxID=3114390 RepID=UPI003CCB7F5B
MAELVGKRYAEALFEVAIELDKLETFKEEINGVSHVFNNEPQLKTVFEHPKLSNNEKKDIINSIFKDRVSGEILNLLYILVDKRREKFVSDISKEYTILSNEEQGIIEAKAITAVKMSDKEKEKLQDKLSKKLDKTVILTNAVDEKVLGGVLLKIEDRVIDSSIQGQIEEIKKNLSNVRIAK